MEENEKRKKIEEKRIEKRIENKIKRENRE